MDDLASGGILGDPSVDRLLEATYMSEDKLIYTRGVHENKPELVHRVAKEAGYVLCPICGVKL